MCQSSQQVIILFLLLHDIFLHHHHLLLLLILLLLLLLPKVLHLALSAVSGCGKSGEGLADINNSFLEQAVLAFKKEGRLCCCWEEVEGRVKEEF